MRKKARSARRRIPPTEEPTAIPIVALVLRDEEEEGADLESAESAVGVLLAGFVVGVELGGGVLEGPAVETVGLGGGDGSLKLSRLLLVSFTFFHFLRLLVFLSRERRNSLINHMHNPISNHIIPLNNPRTIDIHLPSLQRNSNITPLRSLQTHSIFQIRTIPHKTRYDMVFKHTLQFLRSRVCCKCSSIRERGCGIGNEVCNVGQVEHGLHVGILHVQVVSLVKDGCEV